jgi:hypothetical protein
MTLVVTLLCCFFLGWRMWNPSNSGTFGQNTRPQHPRRNWGERLFYLFELSLFPLVREKWIFSTLRRLITTFHLIATFQACMVKNWDNICNNCRRQRELENSSYRQQIKTSVECLINLSEMNLVIFKSSIDIYCVFLCTHWLKSRGRKRFVNTFKWLMQTMLVNLLIGCKYSRMGCQKISVRPQRLHCVHQVLSVFPSCHFVAEIVKYWTNEWTKIVYLKSFQVFLARLVGINTIKKNEISEFR